MIRNRISAGHFLVLLHLLILLIGAACADAQADQIMLSAEIGGDIQHTRFVAFLSKRVEYRIFSIADPYRIVIDLPEADIQVPAGKSRGLVLSSRSGLLSGGKARIVIDLVEPALVEKAELLPPENGLPARLVIELARSTHKAFVASAKVPPPTEPVQKPAIAKNSADKRPLIIIDPGHGGVDAGAHGRVTNMAEKDITLEFCRTVAAKLEASGRYRVLMTRDQDIFVPLDERAQIAAEQKADLLVSIHADTLDVRRFGLKSLQEVRGGTVYTLAEAASDEHAQSMEQHENKADIEAGVASDTRPPAVSEEINSILSDLESRTKKNRSLSLARYLIDHLKDKMRFSSRPHRSANLRVLKAPAVPAVLFELGFLSNDDDEHLLTSSEWRNEKAALLAETLNAFMSERQAQIPF